MNPVYPMTETLVKNQNTLDIETHGFSVSSKDHSSHARVQVWSGSEGPTHWYFFWIAETFENTPETLKNLEILFAATHSEVRSSIEGQEGIGTENLFDHILTSLNTAWRDVIPKKLHDVAKTGNISIGLIKDGHLCIADRGRIGAYMVLTEAPHSGKLIPIIDAKSGTSVHTPTFFESVVCGTIQGQARVIIGTPLLHALGGADALLTLLNKPTTTLTDIADRTKKKLTHVGLEAGAFLLIGTRGKVPPTTTTVTPQGFPLSEYLKTPPESHTKLFFKGGRLLRTSIIALLDVLLKIAGAIGRVFQKIKPRWFRMPEKWASHTKNSSAILSSWGNKVTHNEKVSSTGKTITTVSRTLLRTILLFLLWCLMHVVRPLQNGLASLWKRFVNLRRTQKLLVGSSVFLFVLLIVGIQINAYSTQKTARTAHINAIISRIHEEKQIAESKLVFNDISSARTSLRTIEALLSSIIPTNASESLRIELTKKELDPLYKEIKKETRITSMDEVAVFPQPPNGSPAFVERLTQTSTGYVAWNNGRLLQKSDGTVLTIGNEQSMIQNAYPHDNDLLLFTTSGMIRLDLTKNTGSTIELITDELEKNIATHLPYGKFLYVIDSNGIIWKHPESTTGFAKPMVWLKGASPIKNPQSIGSDGNLYVLDNGSTIYKFFRGEATAFETDPVEPKFTQATEIWTDNDARFVYVCEPSKNRIVVLDKNGILVTQYILPGTAFAGFAIDEKNHVGFITQDHKVKRFTLTHLK